MTDDVRPTPDGGKLWGGRFEKEADPSIEAFTRSLPFDQRMAVHDIRGSVAHARMLGRCGIIPADEAAAIERGLGNGHDALAVRIMEDHAGQAERPEPRHPQPTDFDPGGGQVLVGHPD